MSFPPEFTAEDQLATGFIEKMSRGSTDGLKALYGLYQAPLLAFIKSVVRETGGAEEVLQDAFVRVYEKADTYNPEKGTPFVWLATIARRKAIDWLRKDRRRPQIIASLGEQPDDFVDTYKSDDDFSVHQNLEAQWAIEFLRDLPPEQSQVVELAFLRGYTHYEIAECLGKPLGTVKSDLRRGLMRLRKAYTGEND